MNLGHLFKPNWNSVNILVLLMTHLCTGLILTLLKMPWYFYRIVNTVIRYLYSTFVLWSTVL